MQIDAHSDIFAGDSFYKSLIDMETQEIINPLDLQNSDSGLDLQT